MPSKGIKRRKATVCPNCETPLLNMENYCPTCGQENNSKQASIKVLFNDFMGDYFVFDSRLFRSIVPLVLQPGRITIDYLNGKRQQFIPPIRVFLFLSFLYFGLSYIFGIESGSFEFSAGDSGEAARAVNDSFNKNFNILLFLFTPLFALLVRLFFKSEKRNYYVNFFVYSLHLFSVSFILSTLQILIFKLFELTLPQEIDETASTIVQLLSLVYIIYYSIVSLKRVFEKKYTFLRFLALLIISNLAFLILALLGFFVLILLNQNKFVIDA